MNTPNRMVKNYSIFPLPQNLFLNGKADFGLLGDGFLAFNLLYSDFGNHGHSSPYAGVACSYTDKGTIANNFSKRVNLSADLGRRSGDCP